MSILVTGGLGFIGSHTSVQLLEHNYNVIILDDLSNSKLSVLDKIKEITLKSNIKFYNGSILNSDTLTKIFNDNNINLVIHFAGVKSVYESIENPLKYYDVNVNGTINLIKIMNEFNCNKLIFSSSCTVYGKQSYPVNELATSGLNITNPYGKTKYIIEEILKDLCNSKRNFKVISLRYFNPIGAHKSGLIGENPNGVPNNLMPILFQVIQGKIPELLIYGKNYNTLDGTCIRDFIHVEDLAYGHVLSIDKIDQVDGFLPINLGTGMGTSVLELINMFEKVNGIKINYLFTDRRAGDIDIVYADTTFAANFLGFKCKYTIQDCCLDSYNYYLKNNSF